MTRAQRPAQRSQFALTLAGLTSALMLGACSQAAELLPSAKFLTAEAEAPPVSAESGQSELQKATVYWGQEYAKRPSDLNNALSYARNLKALGEKQKALAVLQEASSIHNTNAELAGDYGRLALELGQINVADRLLAVADSSNKTDWRIVSARGTVLAKQGQYKQAIPFYERALSLSSNQPSVLNNLAMAHAMNGEPAKAEELLRQATTETGATPKVSQNLALVLGLQGRYDEAKTFAVTGAGAEAVRADADLLRTMVKASPQLASAAAIPAFTTHVARAQMPAADAASALRPPVVETASGASDETLIAKTASAAMDQTAGGGMTLKGSSR